MAEYSSIPRGAAPQTFLHEDLTDLGADQHHLETHTHTLVNDVTETAEGTLTCLSSSSCFDSNHMNELATLTKTFASGSRAVGFAFAGGRGTASACVLSLIMGCTTVASQTMTNGVWDTVSLVGIRALSGSQVVKVNVSKQVQFRTELTGQKIAVGVGVGSIKV